MLPQSSSQALNPIWHLTIPQALNLSCKRPLNMTKNSHISLSHPTMPTFLFAFISLALTAKSPSFTVPHSQVFTHIQTLSKGVSLALKCDLTNAVVFIGTNSGKYTKLKRIATIGDRVYDLTAPGFFDFGNENGTVTITATAKESIWIIASYVGPAPTLCSQIRAAIGDLTLTSNETKSDICFFRTSPRVDVAVSGSLGTSGQLHVRRRSEHKAVKLIGKSESKEAKIDALIVKTQSGEGAEALNLRLLFSESKTAYRFGPVGQEHFFGIHGYDKVTVPKEAARVKSKKATGGFLPHWWKGGRGIWFLVDLLGLFDIATLAYDVFRMLTQPAAKPGLFARIFQPAKGEMNQQIRQITLAASGAAILFACLAPWFTMRIVGLGHSVWLLVKACVVAGFMGVIGAALGQRQR
jgi:hypothetical protein